MTKVEISGAGNGLSVKPPSLYSILFSLIESDSLVSELSDPLSYTVIHKSSLAYAGINMAHCQTQRYQSRITGNVLHQWAYACKLLREGVAAR